MPQPTPGNRPAAMDNRHAGMARRDVAEPQRHWIVLRCRWRAPRLGGRVLDRDAPLAPAKSTSTLGRGPRPNHPRGRGVDHRAQCGDPVRQISANSIAAPFATSASTRAPARSPRTPNWPPSRGRPARLRHARRRLPRRDPCVGDPKEPVARRGHGFGPTESSPPNTVRAPWARHSSARCTESLHTTHTRGPRVSLD